ncbi:helix-turn-helix domain-containing protein [Streptomyces roseifaciens]
MSEAPVPPLTRPQLAEARRMRAVELFEQGRPDAEVARMVGIHPESVRRWKRTRRSAAQYAPFRETFPRGSSATVV